MRLIDRIALNRLIKLFIDLIIRLVEIFEKKKDDQNIKPRPSPSKPKPIKKIIDTLFPWRTK